MRSIPLPGVGLLWVLLVVSILVATPVAATDTPVATSTPVDGASGGNDTDRAVVFYDQETGGDELVVARANVSEGGFVAAFAESPNGTLLGTSAYLEPGDHETVVVDLTTGSWNDTTVAAVVYRDSNDNRTFDPGDDPYRVDGTVVSDTAYVTAAIVPTTMTAATSATDTVMPVTATDTTAAETEAPGFGLPVAALALAVVLAAALRARR